MNATAKTKLMLTTESKKSEKFVDVYSNNTKLSLTYVDFSVTFGRVIEAGVSSIVEEDVLVRMSPRAFKMLITNAASMIKGWEAQCGEISLNGASTPPEELARKLQDDLGA